MSGNLDSGFSDNLFGSDHPQPCDSSDYPNSSGNPYDSMDDSDNPSPQHNLDFRRRLFNSNSYFDDSPVQNDFLFCPNFDHLTLV